MVGFAHGWVAGRAGFWGAVAAWVWGQQLQSPGSWAPNATSTRDAGVTINIP